MRLASAWLPRLSAYETMHCDHDGEFEGVEVELCWAGFRFSAAFCRRTRVVKDADRAPPTDA